MKKLVSLVLAACMAVGLAGCGASSSEAQQSSSAQSQSEAPSSVSQPESAAEKTDFVIAGMKGPTTMGMVKLMSDAEAGTTRHNYQVDMYATAQEILPLMVKGEVDVAMLPANVASNLYNQTEGKVQVAAINTLGVLYVVENGDSVQSVADLKGKTIYSTGKNNTPEYTLNYILSQNGIDPASDVTVEYKSEATEVTAMLADAGEGAVAVLPQPYVTIACTQNENLRVALDLTEEWDKVNADSTLVTGVLVVNSDFAKENEAAFAEFLEDYEASIDYVNANVSEAAELVANYGIVPKAAVAEKALPACNIVYIAGEEMKTDLQGYLQVLYDQNPDSVGGALPGDDFYYGA